VIDYLARATSDEREVGQLMHGVIRTILTVVVAAGLWTAGTSMAPTAKADVEMLMVPSAAMGRDIPVAFSGGGPHAVVLLDAFNAAPDVSNWVTAGNAMNTLAGQGISVAAPAGGAWSMYTNWEADGSRQWETFLATELPDFLAATKGLAPGGHGIVGAAQGGFGALAMATFHPNRYRFAGSLSGFVAPERTGVDGAITAGLAQFGGVDTRNMWGLPQLGRWKWHSPNVHVQLLADNNTRLWLYSPTAGGCDAAAMIGYCDIAAGTNKEFYQHYRSVGGHNGHFDFPVSGGNDWGSWSGQLAAMTGELASTIK
jgi:S-formylglutathione hydrolase FrmB